MRRLPSSDGVEVAAYDLGGEGPSLLLVHATGFCGQVLAPLAAHLRRAYRCWALDLRGHGRTSSPGGLDYAWAEFADDVLAAVDGLELERPLAGFGHSSGGAALLLAEAERPGTFSGLWCYEPIVWSNPERARARAARLAEGARRRRDRFPSRAEAIANFSSKPPLSRFAAEALAAYVEHGFEDEPGGGVTLRCRGESEAAVYLQAVEGDRFTRLDEVRCPAVVGCGSLSDAIDPDQAAVLAAALPHGRRVVFDGLGHFGPLEDPEGVAAAVLAGMDAAGIAGGAP